MAHNKLEVRMLQKSDKLDSWLSSSIVPLKGEICVALGGNGKAVETRIGNGIDVYSSLPCQSKPMFVGSKTEYDTIEEIYPIGSIVILTGGTIGIYVKQESGLVAITSSESSPFTGATEEQDGSIGLVPQPTKDDLGKVLGANGEWVECSNIEPITASEIEADWAVAGGDGSITYQSEVSPISETDINNDWNN